MRYSADYIKEYISSSRRIRETKLRCSQAISFTLRGACSGMVLNQELNFSKNEWITFSILVLIVILNTGFSMTGMSFLKSLYVSLLAWISYPAIAVSLAYPVLTPAPVHNVRRQQSERAAASMFSVTVVLLSAILTISVPILVSRCMALHPILLLFLYAESWRFSLKTLYFAFKTRTGSGEGNFIRFLMQVPC